MRITATPLAERAVDIAAILSFGIFLLFYTFDFFPKGFYLFTITFTWR
jgi:hypothetical protein